MFLKNYTLTQYGMKAKGAHIGAQKSWCSNGAQENKLHNFVVM